MKKINLSIPRPCHESWDQMTQGEKGKFCASCQKTVVDFTNMSDRQLAEFFKKPGSSTCGRFHADQLNRDIGIPAKRIPWIKYFFQITWPAFVFFLKSCGLKNEVPGKAKIEANRSQEKNALMTPTIGVVLENITAVDTPRLIEADTYQPKTTKIIRDTILNTEPLDPSGDSCPMPETVTGDLLSSPLTRNHDSTAINIIPKPIPVLPACPSIEGTLGGVVVVGYSINQKRQRPVGLIKKIVDTAFKKFSVYPNPVQRNSNMKIDLRKLEQGQYVISIISAAGEVVQTEEIVVGNKNQLVDFRLNEIAAGTYFIHVFNRKTAASYSEKVIVQ